MAIGVTLPIIAPSGLEATLQTGGSLDVDTTYYYIVIAFDSYDVSPAAVYAQLCFHSPISEESFFTTSGTELSALINWINVPGATNYQLLVSEISGDYTGSKMYGTAAETIGDITDGPTGYTVTALGTDVYAHHSCQVVNNLPGHLDKDLGIINVALSGTETHDLQDLYDEIVSAGFSEYAYWDGAQFVLKGTISVANGLADAGSLVVVNKKIALVRGCLANLGTNYIIQFGTWESDAAGANYYNSCVFEIGNPRFPIYGKYDHSIKFYGSIVRTLLFDLNLSENSFVSFYHGAASFAFQGYVDEWRDCIMGAKGRGQLGVVKDLKWNEQNNWSGSYKLRLKITGQTYSHAWTNGRFYACDFTTVDYFTGAYYDYNNQQNVYLYDCTFTYTDNLVPLDKITYNSILAIPLWEYGAQGEFFFWFHNTFKVTVIDENGDPIEGVTISAVDVDGTTATWIENDGTFDKLITGTTYTTNRTTDSNGQIEYYLESYKMHLDPEYSGSKPSFDGKRYSKYPYTITFTKLGYIGTSFKIDMWRAEDTIVTMKSSYLSNKITTNKLVKRKITP